MKPSDINRLVVARNPISTNADRVGEQVLRPLSQSQWQYHELYTNSPDSLRNINAMAEFIEEGDLLVSCGGDGLANIVTNAVLRAELESAKIVYLPFGNGNDISRGLNGPERKQDLLRMLDEGYEKPVSPIEVLADDSHIRYALGYVGLGMTGKGASVLNSTAHRTNKRRSHLPKRMLDIHKVVPAALRPEPFGYTGIDGQEAAAFDISYVNGPYMARLIKINAHFDDDEMQRLETSARISALASTVLKIVMTRPFNGMAGKSVHEDEILLHDNTIIHYDGEPEKALSGTAFNIRKSQRRITTLITNPS